MEGADSGVVLEAGVDEALAAVYGTGSWLAVGVLFGLVGLRGSSLPSLPLSDDDEPVLDSLLSEPSESSPLSEPLSLPERLLLLELLLESGARRALATPPPPPLPLLSL